jgi:hypothetical protein
MAKVKRNATNIIPMNELFGGEFGEIIDHQNLKTECDKKLLGVVVFCFQINSYEHQYIALNDNSVWFDKNCTYLVRRLPKGTLIEI